MTSPPALAPAGAPSVVRHRARLALAAWAVVVIGGGRLFVGLDRASGQVTGTGGTTTADGSTSGQGLWILVPALVSLGLYLFVRDGGGSLGLKPLFRHPLRWYGLAAGLFPAVAAMLVGIGVVSGLATVSVTASAGTPALGVAIAGALGFLLIKNTLEEFIFRGYGTRTAVASGLPGIWPHVVVGLVWALWHLPLYLVWMSAADIDDVTSVPMALFLPLFVAGVIGLALLYGEIRLRTGSIWPVVVLHTISNAIATPLLLNGHVIYQKYADVVVGPVPGSIASAVVFGGIGLLLYRRRTVGA